MSPSDLTEALAAIAGGSLVVLIDDDGGPHLVGDAARVLDDDVVMMLRVGGGIFSVAISESRRIELGLDPQERPGDPVGRRIAVAVDAVDGITTGISAEERALTARVVADPNTRPRDLVVPGHVPPLLASNAGVLGKRGVAEAATDLVRMAGGSGAATVCAMLDDSGAVRDPDSARKVGAALGINPVTITELSRRRIHSERPAKIINRKRVIGRHGTFTAVRFVYEPREESHLALLRGAVEGAEEVRVMAAAARPDEDLLAALDGQTGSDDSSSIRQLIRTQSGILVHLQTEAGSRASYDILAAVLLELGPASIVGSDEMRVELACRGIEIAGGAPSPARHTSQCL